MLGGGLLVGTAACSDSKNAQAQTTLVANNNGDEWDVVRDLFDVDPAYKHFAGFLIVSHPRPVREAIDHHRRELDRNPALYLEHNWQTLDTAPRNAAAKFIGADPGEVAMTDSTTMGLGLLYGGFKLRPGQQVLTTVHDHYSTHEALRFRASRDGANIKKVRLFADSAKATEAEITKRLADAINDRTRIVAVTWVHSSTGMKLPIRALADVVATANKGRAEADRAILCVDGVHG
ncbi:MAG: aminotransferase class V-fold PLP-dependent enzyme, partial [Planctomycetota bacterium]